LPDQGRGKPESQRPRVRRKDRARRTRKRKTGQRRDLHPTVSRLCECGVYGRTGRFLTRLRKNRQLLPNCWITDIQSAFEMSRQHDRELYHRQSMRRADHDYSGNGVYSVTIPPHDKAVLFGSVDSGVLVLNDAAQMIIREWRDLERRFQNISTDMIVVMPDHVHGILILQSACDGRNVAAHDEQPSQGRPAPNRRPGYEWAGPNDTVDIGLPRVMQAFKSITTLRYGDGVRNMGWQPFNGKVWHRNYYDHIVRSHGELDTIRSYMLHNPGKLIESQHPRRRLTVGRRACLCPVLLILLRSSLPRL
jgi:putative transposase